MTTLLLRVDSARAEQWRQSMQDLLPELNCRLWTDVTPPDCSAELAAVWSPPAGGLAKLKRLKAVFSIGAGVDHVLKDPDYPQTVPLFKTIAPELSQRMVEYVLLHTLRYHRRLPELAAQQARGEWQILLSPLAHERTVGVLGLGHLGVQVAFALRDFGFNVQAWSRSQKQHKGIECFAGAQQLKAFLANCEILICLLPLTPNTRTILNAELFAALPQGAYIINVARGEHLVEEDLLLALEQNLAGATLDVFVTEPLPSKHPFWQHPNITITPHIASMIDPLVGSPVLAGNIRRFLANEPLSELRVDVHRGY